MPDAYGVFVARIYAVLFFGYFWFGASKLFAEGRGWNLTKYLACALPLFLCVALFIFYSPQWHLYLSFFIPALLSFIIIAPFSKRANSDDFSFWFYNYSTWFGVACAVLSGLILMGGLSAALASIHYLFDVKIDSEVYADIATFAGTLFGPLCALSWVSREFYFKEEECKTFPGLKFIINWLLAPLVILYLVILYAYLVKIMFTWELPRGQLAYMMTGFGGLGIVTYLVAWPVRDQGSVQLMLFYRWFFPALIGPVFMQSLAIALRISEYGVTEDRYAIVMTALWFGITAAMFTVGKPSLKTIPSVLAALLVFAAVGPWGAVSVSGYSQHHRLEQLMAKYDILKDGHIVKTDMEIPFVERQNISSILDYMNNSGRGEWLGLEKYGPVNKRKLCSHSFFMDECQGPPSTYLKSREVTQMMGFEYVSQWEQSRGQSSFYYNSTYGDSLLDVKGYDYALTGVFMNPSVNEQSRSICTQPKIRAEMTNGILSITYEDKQPINFDTKNFLNEHLDKNHQFTKDPMTMEMEASVLKIKIIFKSINGEMNNGEPKITDMNFDLLIGNKP